MLRLFYLQTTTTQCSIYEIIYRAEMHQNVRFFNSEKKNKQISLVDANRLNRWLQFEKEQHI